MTVKKREMGYPGYMPITPTEAACLTEKEITAIRSYERYIDSELKLLFTGGTRGVTIALVEPPTPREALYLRMQYLKLGWQVSDGARFLGEGNFTFYFQAKDPIDLHEGTPKLVRKTPIARIHAVEIEGETDEPSQTKDLPGEKGTHPGKD
jgi:hypothetical protein